LDFWFEKYTIWQPWVSHCPDVAWSVGGGRSSPPIPGKRSDWLTKARFYDFFRFVPVRYIILATFQQKMKHEMKHAQDVHGKLSPSEIVPGPDHS
jgi:hypothetical protein